MPAFCCLFGPPNGGSRKAKRVGIILNTKIMKKTRFLALMLLLFCIDQWRAQTWEWATKLEGTLGAADEVTIKAIDVDVNGYSYVTGYYTGQLNSAAINTSN